MDFLRSKSNFYYPGKKLTMNKKLISSITLVIVLVSFAPLTYQAQGDTSSALAYLKTKTPNSWITMALATAGETPNVDYLKTFSGTKATDYEAPILALSAASKDPRTFPNENFVTKLESFYSDNQIGDTSIINDDIFGILALISAGESADSAIIQGSKNFVLNNQNSDGSWSFAVGASGDTNMTSMAIMALSEVGVPKTDPKISKALDYLKSAQNPDGGFPYDPKSSFSTSSDASSDSWVISALNKVGESPASWTQNAQSPIDHLNTLATATGFYEFQKGTGEDSFTPITTSYALIALLNKSYPVEKFTPPISPLVSYRIVGGDKDLCVGKVNAPNPLEIVKIIAADCGVTYHIKDTSFGPYLDQIGSDVATGSIGWLYAVNFTSPSVGAMDYALKADDQVLWYYGDFNWKLTRITLSNSEIPSGGSAQATVEYFDSGSWHPLEGATLHFGTNTAATNSSGQASLSPADGAYKIFATKDGHLRSEEEKLIVGQKTETSLNLTANILAGSAGGGGTPGGDSVGFNITLSGGGSNLSFGDVTPGSAKSENITLKNQGQKNLYLEGSVNGDDVFVNYLRLDSKNWQDYSAQLNVGENRNTKVELNVPSSYTSSGSKTGQLIFWAIPLN